MKYGPCATAIVCRIHLAAPDATSEMPNRTHQIVAAYTRSNKIDPTILRSTTRALARGALLAQAAAKRTCDEGLREWYIRRRIPYECTKLDDDTNDRQRNAFNHEHGDESHYHCRNEENRCEHSFLGERCLRLALETNQEASGENGHDIPECIEHSKRSWLRPADGTQYIHIDGGWPDCMSHFHTCTRARTRRKMKAMRIAIQAKDIYKTSTASSIAVWRLKHARLKQAATLDNVATSTT